MTDAFEHALSLQHDIAERLTKAAKRQQRLRDALDLAILHMATHASKTGSMHGWWDVIGELREVRDND